MSSTETQREQETVVGQLTGIVQKGTDKWQAVVMPDGSQYTKNLWTKDENLIRTLAGMINQRIAFLCNASHWNMQDGTPVRSLWIDQVGMPANGAPASPPQGYAAEPPPWVQTQQAQAQAQAQGGYQNVPQQTLAPPPLPTVQVTPTVVNQDVKEQRIHRQTASKVAAIMLTHVQPEERTMSTLLVLAERLVAYYNEGLPVVEPTLDDLIVQAMPREVDEGPQPLAADDGIPF